MHKKLPSKGNVFDCRHFSYVLRRKSILLIKLAEKLFDFREGLKVNELCNILTKNMHDIFLFVSFYENFRQTCKLIIIAFSSHLRDAITVSLLKKNVKSILAIECL